VSLLISLAPAGLPRWHAFEIDRMVLAYALGASLIAAVLFGLAPALTASSPRLNETLKAGGRASMDGPGGNRFRGGLMIAEVALSVVLLTGAGLLIRSFVQLLDVNPGFDASRVLMLPIGLPSFAYPDAARQVTFYDQAIEAARAIPGVEAVGAIDDLPLSGDRDANAIAIAGRPPQALHELPVAQVRSVSPDYFRTMRIPLIAGRAFDSRDASTSPAVVLITQTTAHRLFPGEDPVGQRLTYGVPTTQSQWLTIVGIVGDVRDLGLEEQADLEVYQPYPQATFSYMTLVVRTTGSPAASIGVVRDAIHRIDPALPLSEGQAMESVVAFALAARWFNMLLLGLLAAIALVLAGVGIYGVIAYGVVRRRREIGVRVALGAQRRDVLTLVIGRGLRLTGIGIAAGVAASLLLTRLLASLLYSVHPHDPLTLTGVAALLVAVALLASYLPARRALRVDPTVTLRQE
jgi:putative ABC transport system permease protein